MWRLAFVAVLLAALLVQASAATVKDYLTATDKDDSDGDTWVILVAASTFSGVMLKTDMPTYDYRHQAAICEAYQVLW